MSFGSLFQGSTGELRGRAREQGPCPTHLHDSHGVDWYGDGEVLRARHRPAALAEIAVPKAREIAPRRTARVSPTALPEHIIVHCRRSRLSCLAWIWYRVPPRCAKRRSGGGCATACPSGWTRERTRTSPAFSDYRLSSTFLSGRSCRSSQAGGRAPRSRLPSSVVPTAPRRSRSRRRSCVIIQRLHSAFRDTTSTAPSSRRREAPPTRPTRSTI